MAVEKIHTFVVRVKTAASREETEAHVERAIGRRSPWLKPHHPLFDLEGKVEIEVQGKYDTAPASGDMIMTVAEFRDDVKAGHLIDYDGFGHPMKGGWVDETVTVKPSKAHDIPEDATHVVWYGR